MYLKMQYCRWFNATGMLLASSQAAVASRCFLVLLEFLLELKPLLIELQAPALWVYKWFY